MTTKSIYIKAILTRMKPNKIDNPDIWKTFKKSLWKMTFEELECFETLLSGHNEYLVNQYGCHEVIII